MATDTKKRNQILRRIQRIPSSKLNELEDFLSKLEKTTSNKDRILSFAGAWKDIEDEVFDELTTKLHAKRTRSKRRING